MTPDEMLIAAETLEQLEFEHKQETGYGNCTVRGIAYSLRRGSLKAAQLEWYHDGDKVQLYPKLKNALTRLLGCRLHQEHGCQNWICRRINVVQ